MLKAAISRWVRYDHKGMDTVSNNSWVGCGVVQETTPLHHQQHSKLSKQVRMDSWFHVVYITF